MIAAWIATAEDDPAVHGFYRLGAYGPIHFGAERLGQRCHLSAKTVVTYLHTSRSPDGKHANQSD